GLCPDFVEFGQRVLRACAGEIGVHLHAWNTPPISMITQNDFAYGPYAFEYTPDLIAEKRLCARIRRTGGLMGFRWHGGFRYTAWFEKQRLDKDSGLAGLPGVSERDRRTGQDAETMGAAEVWQVGLLRVRPERARDRRSL